MTAHTETPEPAKPESTTLTEKQQMVEKLFQQTNKFLEENKHDPLLVVEALAAIVVRYTALFGPMAQIGERLHVLERLISQESTQIQAIAKSADWPKRDPG
jgi:hypothetical protein